MKFIRKLRKRFLLKKIYKFIHQHDLKNALSIIDQVPKERRDRDIFYALSIIYLTMNEPERAMEAIDQAITEEDGNPAFMVQKAKILQLQKKYHESIKILEASSRLTIFNEEVLYLQAINHLAINDYIRANELFYEALKTIDKRFIESRFAMAAELLVLKFQKENETEALKIPFQKNDRNTIHHLKEEEE